MSTYGGGLKVAGAIHVKTTNADCSYTVSSGNYYALVQICSNVDTFAYIGTSAPVSLTDPSGSHDCPMKVSANIPITGIILGPGDTITIKDTAGTEDMSITGVLLSN